jgi:GNAT superfamily N-acetyltransferase
MTYRIVTPTNIAETIQLLDERLYEYNAKTIQKKDGRLFSFIAKEDAAKMVAGIAGWIWANACEITLLWVDEEYRGKGFGKELLGKAEKEAANAGCKVILIRSYAFQAPAFYQKQGYKVEHIIDDFPEGCKYYTLIKRI